MSSRWRSDSAARAATSIAMWIGWLGEVWGLRMVIPRHVLRGLGGSSQRKLRLLEQIWGEDTWILLVKRFVVINFINHFFLYRVFSW